MSIVERVIFSTWTIAALAVCVLVYGLIHSWIVADYQWFQRTGNIIALLGLMVSLPGGVLSRRDQLKNGPEVSRISPDPGTQEYHRLHLQQKRSHSDEALGLILTALGLVIGSYGDLIS